MITRERIMHERDASFEACWRLYVSAFPREERRCREYQLETLLHREYHLEALFAEECFVGFVAWWDFDALIYIEHLAILPQYRSSGYGRVLLSDFVARCGKRVVLEVELPVEEMQARRIGFYERLGFHLSDAEYAQPPYAGEGFVPLRLMGYPEPLSGADVEAFKRDCLARIHFRLDWRH